MNKLKMQQQQQLKQMMQPLKCWNDFEAIFSSNEVAIESPFHHQSEQFLAENCLWQFHELIDSG